ncbi:MAG: hypothetical protein ABSG15_07410 [FCB group bacterium]|jgi:dienelactone hydrolase
MKKLIFLIVIVLLLITKNTFAQEDNSAKIEELKPYVLKYFELFKKNDFANISKMMDTTSHMQFPPEQLKMMLKMPLAPFGDFIEITDMNYSNEVNINGNNDVIFVSYDLERADVIFKFIFSDDHKIKEVFMTSIKEKNLYAIPDYVDTTSFTEQEISFGIDNWKLPGVLSIPNGEGPFPLVILVQDTGPNDRDETIGSNKPFRDLALGLASNGIAVFRYDNRTKIHQINFMNKIKNYTIKDEVTDDVLSALDTLKLFNSINPKRIILLGHGYGGYALPRIAEADGDIKGLIFLAGITRNPEDVILDQYIFLLSRDKEGTEGKGIFLDSLKASIERVKDSTLSLATPAFTLPMNIPASYWLDLRGYNPAKLAITLKQPMLFLQGKRDYKVTIDDFNIWKKDLTSRKDVHFKLYPKLNHLFMEGKGKSSPEEERIPGNIAGDVITDIVDWMKTIK